MEFVPSWRACVFICRETAEVRTKLLRIVYAMVWHLNFILNSLGNADDIKEGSHEYDLCSRKIFLTAL